MPIQERIKHIEQRLDILQRTIEELSTRPSRYQTAQMGPVIFNQVHQNIRAEQLQLAAERNVLLSLADQQAVNAP